MSSLRHYLTELQRPLHAIRVSKPDRPYRDAIQKEVKTIFKLAVTAFFDAYYAGWKKEMAKFLPRLQKEIAKILGVSNLSKLSKEQEERIYRNLSLELLPPDEPIQSELCYMGKMCVPATYAVRGVSV